MHYWKRFGVSFLSIGSQGQCPCPYNLLQVYLYLIFLPYLCSKVFCLLAHLFSLVSNSNVLLSLCHVTLPRPLLGHMTFPRWLPPWQWQHGWLPTCRIDSFHSGSWFSVRRLCFTSPVLSWCFNKRLMPCHWLLLIIGLRLQALSLLSTPKGTDGLETRVSDPAHRG